MNNIIHGVPAHEDRTLRAARHTSHVTSYIAKQIRNHPGCAKCKSFPGVISTRARLNNMTNSSRSPSHVGDGRKGERSTHMQRKSRDTCGCVTCHTGGRERSHENACGRLEELEVAVLQHVLDAQPRVTQRCSRCRQKLPRKFNVGQHVSQGELCGVAGHSHHTDT